MSDLQYNPDELGDDSFDIERLDAVRKLIPKANGLGIVKLRDYQVECVDSVYDSWQDNQAVLAVLATGLGKTVIAADVIIRWPGTKRILFIAHVRELIDQAQEKISLHTDDSVSIEMGLRRDGAGMNGHSQVLVASIQTTNRRMTKFNPLDFDLIIIDEFHHAAAPTYRKLWQYFSEGNPDIKLLGITATPNRADGVTVGCMADHCCYQMGIREGIDTGWLVPIKQAYIVVEGLDFSQCRTVAKDLSKDDLAAAMLGGEEHEGMSEDEIRELTIKQEKMLHAVAAPTVEESAGRQGIVYCVTKNHAARMAEVLRRYPGVTAEVIDCDTPENERIDLVKRFKGKQTQFLVNVGVATEGFDCPGAEVIVMARPTKSQTLYTQMIGRATRALSGLVDRYERVDDRQAAIANSTKSHALVLDFCGNSGKHKLISTADVLAGDMPTQFVEAAKKEMMETGEAQDIRAAAWQKKEEHDEEVRRRQEEERKAKEERRKEIQAREEARRAHIRAQAEYRTRNIDPFDTGETAPERAQSSFRGGATDAQIGFLQKLGVPQETSMKWGKMQAGAVINDLKNRTAGAWIMRFGKHTGKALHDIPHDYLRWAAENIQNPEFQTNLELYRNELRNN